MFLLTMSVLRRAGPVFAAQLAGARVESSSDLIPPQALKDFQDFPLNIWPYLIILEHAGKSSKRNCLVTTGRPAWRVVGKYESF